MSRVFEALKKAEKEKREKSRETPSLRIFDEKMVFPKEELPFEHSKENAMELGLPSEDHLEILMVPPNSFAEEQFRKLRTQILLRAPNPPHTILVTSTAPQEGKTMVSVNLALSMSKEIQKRVILIDGDLRNPSIHLRRYPDSKGLSNYLSNQTPLSEILLNSEEENLQIIVAGSSTRKSSELIGSTRMRDLLRSLREFGDDTYIIIDSPPIMATSEPTLLSKMVDGIVLVVMGGKTPKESIRRAVKSIDRQKVIGIVFNQIDLKPSSYYSKYYYRYEIKEK
jgi:capsular exopolysaccharide synthesis family protein